MLAGSVALVAVFGFIDYLAGFVILFSAFYLIPVARAAWGVGGFGLVISVMSVVISLRPIATDTVALFQALGGGWWNLADAPKN